MLFLLFLAELLVRSHEHDGCPASSCVGIAGLEYQRAMIVPKYHARWVCPTGPNRTLTSFSALSSLYCTQPSAIVQTTAQTINTPIHPDYFCLSYTHLRPAYFPSPGHPKPEPKIATLAFISTIFFYSPFWCLHATTFFCAYNGACCSNAFENTVLRTRHLITRRVHPSKTLSIRNALRNILARTREQTHAKLVLRLFKKTHRLSPILTFCSYGERDPND